MTPNDYLHALVAFTAVAAFAALCSYITYKWAYNRGYVAGYEDTDPSKTRTANVHRIRN